MPYMVDPRLWDDERFVTLSLHARYLFTHLLSTPLRTNLPGLIKSASVGALQDGLRFSSELCRDELLAIAGSARNPRLAELLRESAELVMEEDRIGFDLTTAALQELIDVGLVEYDAERRVIRVPKAPRHNTCPNPNVLRSWFSNWRDVPDCELKYVHVEVLEETVPLRNGEMQRAWDTTFGSVNVSALRARQSGQLALGMGPSAELATVNGYPKAFPKAYGKAYPNGSAERLSSGSGSGSGSGEGSGSGSNPLANASPKALSPDTHSAISGSSKKDKSGGKRRARSNSSGGGGEGGEGSRSEATSSTTSKGRGSSGMDDAPSTPAGGDLPYDLE